MEILSLSQILWQIVNFGLFYFVVVKFVVPPLKRMMDQRNTEIESGLANAALVKKQLEEAETQRQSIENEARAEATRILEEARKQAEVLGAKIEDEAKAKAQEESARIVSNAHNEAGLIKEQAREQVIAMATQIARKALPENLNIDMQHALIAKQLDSMKGVAHE